MLFDETIEVGAYILVVDLSLRNIDLLDEIESVQLFIFLRSACHEFNNISFNSGHGSLIAR